VSPPPRGAGAFGLRTTPAVACRASSSAAAANLWATVSRVQDEYASVLGVARRLEPGGPAARRSKLGLRGSSSAARLRPPPQTTALSMALESSSPRLGCRRSTAMSMISCASLPAGRRCGTSLDDKGPVCGVIVIVMFYYL